MSPTLPLLRIGGGPLDVGRQHGRGLRALVRENVRLYLQRFEQEGRIDREETRRRANAYLTVMQQACPAYAEEMRGIAEGSDQDLLDIVAVNVRFEILYSEFARKGMERDFGGFPRVGGCTTIAVLPSLAANRHLFMAENWDWIPGVRGAIVRAEREGLPTSLAFTEAGVAGAKIGMNAAGIGLVVNGLVSDGDTWSRLKAPFHVRCWEILASRTIDEAVRTVTDTKRSCSANFLIAGTDRSEPRVVDVETAPETERLLAPAGGFLAHTNHFMDPDLLGIREPLGDDRPSTHHRLARAQEILRGFAGRDARVCLDDLKAVLRDHDGSPDSICRHEDPTRRPHERFDTVLSAILDLDSREMFVATGPPCEHRYRRIVLAP